MKRVLIVTEAGNAWPSGYLRALIYKGCFLADQIEVHYCSRLWPWLIQILNSSNKFLKPFYNCGLKTLLWYWSNYISQQNEKKIVKLAQNGYDAIYLQKISSLSCVSEIKNKSRARLVYDLNDGVWLPRFSQFKNDQLYSIFQTVDAVTCDNPYGLEVARKYNNSIYLVSDPPQVEMFDKVRNQVKRKESPITIGWLGSPGTTFNLFLIWEALEKVFSQFDKDEVTLRLVGIGNDRRNIPPFEKVQFTILPHYSQNEMIQEVLMMDIGLFPLYNVEDSCARGILKATVYMSAECCVVASPIGQINDLISDRENGVLASTTEEWIENLCLLIKNHSFRKRLARAGLQTVQERYSIRTCYEQLKMALQG